MAPSRPSDSSRPDRGGKRPPATSGRGPRGGGRPKRPTPPGRRPPAAAPEGRGPSTWGSLARKGASRLEEDVRGAGTASPLERERDDWAPEEWIDEGPVRAAAAGAVRRGRTGRPATSVDTTEADVAKAVGAKDAAKFEARLRDAAKAFERERYGDARKTLVALAERMPGNAAVRELLGLTYYRLGRWKQAAAELEAFRDLTGSTEQHPVLADCYRAQRRWTEVEELWQELREVSPSAELVVEGRIVAAGALADRNRLAEAIALLERGFRFPKRPVDHHLRRAYALADLRERAGDLPQARSLFERVAAIDPDFGDVTARVRSLR